MLCFCVRRSIRAIYAGSQLKKISRCNGRKTPLGVCSPQTKCACCTMYAAQSHRIMACALTQSHNHETLLLVVQMRESQHKVCNVRLDLRVCPHTVQNVFVTWSTQSHVHDMTLSLVGPFGCMDLGVFIISF